MTESILLHDWSSVESVFEDFEALRRGSSQYVIADKDDIEILFGSYTYEDYSGNAFVLFRRKSDGKLYEANGSHCSCYGLEGQWEPDDTSIEVLRHRLVNGNLGRNEFADELTQLLDSLEVTPVDEEIAA